MDTKHCSFDRVDYLKYRTIFETNTLDDVEGELTEFNHNAEDLAFELSYTRYQLAKAQEALAAISNMCIGEITMGYKMEAEAIGELIYSATGMNNQELNYKFLASK